MNKSDLILKIINIKPELNKKDANKIVNVFFNTIGLALSKNERVELRGFGAFSVRERRARLGRNPRTGSSVEVSEKKVPFFKMGKGMRERLNR